MDWDWEDGPPRDDARDAPRGGSGDEPQRTEDLAPRDEPRWPDDVERREEPRWPDDLGQPSAPDAPSFADAIDRFERSARATGDTRTDLERPGTRTVEAGQWGLGAEMADRGYDDERPRPPVDRAAARARRRKKVRQRRLIALGVAIIVVILLAVLVVRGCGGPAEGQAAVLRPAPTAATLRVAAATEPLRMATGAAGDEDAELAAFQARQ